MIYFCPARAQLGCNVLHLHIPFVGYLRLWRRGCFGRFVSLKDWKTCKRLF